MRIPYNYLDRQFGAVETEEILDDLDLKAEERSELGRDNGRVVDQSNGPGSLVDHGTTIVLKTL